MGFYVPWGDKTLPGWYNFTGSWKIWSHLTVAQGVKGFLGGSVGEESTWSGLSTHAQGLKLYHLNSIHASCLRGGPKTVESLEGSLLQKMGWQAMVYRPDPVHYPWLYSPEDKNNFTILTGWGKKSKEEWHFMTCEHYMKLKLQCPSIKFYWSSPIHQFLYCPWLFLCFSGRLELSQRRLGDPKILKIYYLALYRRSLLTTGVKVELVVKNPPVNAGDVRDTGLILGWEVTLEKGMATHSNILAWRSPWTEEPGGLLFLGLQRVRHDWSDLEGKSIKTHGVSPRLNSISSSY